MGQRQSNLPLGVRCRLHPTLVSGIEQQSPLQMGLHCAFQSFNLLEVRGANSKFRRMNPTELFAEFARIAVRRARRWAGDSWNVGRLLVDASQTNRRTRRAVRRGRLLQAGYLYLDHQRRRQARWREIRNLVEGF